MDLKEFAELILLSPHMSDKLFLPTEDLTLAGVKKEIKLPEKPSRSSSLAFLPRSDHSRVSFPSVEKIAQVSQRGLALHFFANHELLALELMAFAILRFGDAPPPFLLGLAKIMKEEQEHLKSYLGRMEDFGVQFGDFPTNDFFWNYGIKAQSPLEFVSLISLTFEQANLDFALYYKNVFKNIDDQKTSDILEKVYQDEIGHVKHGLHWFQKWKDADKDDFEVYRQSLPAPLVPSRGKGPIFNREGRLRAGLSEKFIDRMLQENTSKSRPQNLYVCDLFVEPAIGAYKRPFSPTKIENEITHDLEYLMSYLANSNDLVVLSRPVASDFKNKIRALMPNHPEYLQINDGDWAKSAAALVSSRTHRLGKLCPWGFSPKIFKSWQNIPSAIKAYKENDDLAPCFKEGNLEAFAHLVSRDYSRKICKEFISSHSDQYSFLMPAKDTAQIVSGIDEAKNLCLMMLANKQVPCFKSLFSSSGRGFLRVMSEQELEQARTQGWLERELSWYGWVILEPWRERLFDISLLMQVSPKTSNPMLSVRQALIDDRGQYWGHVLRGKGVGASIKHFSDPSQRSLFGSGKLFRDLADFTAKKLLAAGYEGPASIDMYLYRELTSEGTLTRLQPMSEINLRYTMGRVAHSLEKKIAKQVNGVFALCDLPQKGHDKKKFALFVNQYFSEKNSDVCLGDERRQQIERGLFFLTDPRTSRHKFALLMVEEDMAKCFLQMENIGLTRLCY